jgi:hypothetical protein
MQSFLAYVAGQYGRKKEDVATDVLAYLLNRNKSTRTALGRLIAEGGYTLPKTYSIVSRTKGINGVPDLQITDADGSCCAIIENKFWAGLTINQPVGYLKELKAEGGVIVFVVPETRIAKIWKELCRRCEEHGRPIESWSGGRFSGRTANDYIRVVSWDQLIHNLTAGVDKVASQDSETSLFIEQLRRICEVANKERVEVIDPAELSDRRLGQRVKDYAYLATAIAKAAEEKQLFIHLPERKQLRWESCGPGWSGRFGTMSNYVAWLGFDAEHWSTHVVSPLWLTFEDKNDFDELSNLFDPDIMAGTCFEIDRSNGGRALTLPVPVTTGAEADEIIETAVRWLEAIELRLRSL